MGRKKSDFVGKRITIFLHENQVELLDQKAKRLGLSRSKYIETMCNLGDQVENKVSDKYKRG
ncbi:MAG: ribbon-helix-helix domain-containing protein [Treponema sp.]|nr:ribbon-helix-helix domain-containing protein [Treponema sp.]